MKSDSTALSESVLLIVVLSKSCQHFSVRKYLKIHIPRPVFSKTAGAGFSPRGALEASSSPFAG